MKQKNQFKQGLILSLIVIFLSMTVYANSPGNYSQGVNVTVNVTNAPPVITAVNLPSPSIDLIPGGITLVNCTIEAFDWNGGADIVLANATFWDNLSTTFGAADFNLTHYTNDNCSITGTNGYYRNFTCGFNITFYANASTNWVCNATIKDNYTLQNFTDSDFNTTEINPLYAINVTSELNFGEAAVGDTVQDNRTVNITNFGNKAMNISVDGYGLSDGDGLAMYCDINGNITVPNLKFTANPSDATSWAAMAPLSDLQTNITGFSVPKIDLSSVQPGDWFSTFWSLYIDPTNDPFGFCQGVVVFTAWNY